MRKLLIASLLVVGSLGLSAAYAAPPTTGSPVMNSMTKVPPAAEQIASVKAAHAKALKNKAYTAAILKGDTAAAHKMLVAAGAPSDVVVKINDTRKPNEMKAAARIRVSVTCCPLTITIDIVK
jgi:hypothetical protein